MPQIFEIFGYPVEDRSTEAEVARRSAKCPFLGADCDGGGNRHLARIDLTRRPELALMFPSRSTVHAGVCSIQLQPGTSPWIVCPRRLLALRRAIAVPHRAQTAAERSVIALLGYTANTLIGVWPEVKFKYKEVVAGLPTSFDYTIDYVVAPIGPSTIASISHQLGSPERTARKTIESAGYAIVRRDGADFVEEWPSGAPGVVEIMTSSTSGGNKRVRSAIPMAFEDALLGRSGKAPGINYRQVWARMVSQLIVKSEMAMAWGGTAIWVVQDTLVDYICASTALNLRGFLSTVPSEVNLLAFSYGEAYAHPTGILALQTPALFAGPISGAEGPRTPSFEDMIHAPIKPPVRELFRRIAKRRPSTTIRVV